MNRTESCYTHDPRMCRVYKNPDGKPSVRPVSITLQDGTKQQLTRREGKELRKLAKAKRKRVMRLVSQMKQTQAAPVETA